MRTPTSQRSTPQAWVKALRPHHWTKNALVFVAPGLSLPLASSQTFAQATLLFVAICLLASAAYILNDIFDLAADRKHVNKRGRPFASGSLEIRDGFLVAAGLIASALLIGVLCLPWAVTAVLAAYLGGTMAYSLGVKRLPVFDVVMLASLFTLRVLAGCLLIPMPPSPWLLTFSMLLFLGLAMVKRYTELDSIVEAGGPGIDSRGYTAKDLPLLLSAGIASGIGAVLIFMDYLINEHYPREVYSRPALLWAMMPVILLWILRIWHQTVQGQMHEDPVVFALKDRFSLVLAVVAALILGAAWS